MLDKVPPAAPLRYVFVYGTLRRGGINDINRLHPRPRFVGAAQVQGVLYHLGDYPGMTLGGNEWVQGEVYAMDPALEPALDEIEDLGSHPTDEYVKRQISVDVGGQCLECLVYEINPRYAIPALRVIEGDWMKAIAAAAHHKS
jgi:gamma-glutamylcyclotransferase (GGCT)/AIG2-like uncharacterized protein YtfP